MRPQADVAHDSGLGVVTQCLQAFETYVKDTTAKLSRKISDLEDVHFIMPVLKEVCATWFPFCSQIAARFCAADKHPVLLSVAKQMLHLCMLTQLSSP